MDRLRLKQRNWRSRLEEQKKWFFFFYLLALKLENILFGTHLAKWGIFSNRITNLMSRPLKSGVWYHLELPVHTCPQCGKQTGIRNLCMAAQLSISGSRGIRYCDGKTQALYLKPGFSQGTGRQDLSGEYPEGQRAQENWLIFKDSLFRAEQSILTGRKPGMSGKGDEELLRGLQHNRIIRGANMGTGYPEEAQKYIPGMQGQNQACQISTAVKTGEECGGQQGRFIQSHWNKRRAEKNEAALS